MKGAIFTITVFFSLSALSDPFREGVKKYKKEKYDEAQSSFTEGLIKSPEDFRLHYNLGNSAYKMKDYEKAEKSYLTALSYLKGNAEVEEKIYYNLGNTYFRQGKLDKSIIFYRKALELKPDDEDAKKNLAFVMRLLEEMKKQAEKTQEKTGKLNLSEGKSKGEDSKEKEEKEKSGERRESESHSREAGEMILNSLDDKMPEEMMRERKGMYEVEKNW